MIARRCIREQKPLPPICIHGMEEIDCRVCMNEFTTQWAERRGVSLNRCRHRRVPLQCEKCRDICLDAALANALSQLWVVCPWKRPPPSPQGARPHKVRRIDEGARSPTVDVAQTVQRLEEGAGSHTVEVVQTVLPPRMASPVRTAPLLVDLTCPLVDLS